MESSIVFLIIGTLAVLADCWIIYRSGRVALADGYDSPAAADAANRMITAPFLLVLLGAVALLSTANFGNDPMIDVVTKLGVLALALAAVHGGASALLGNLRERKRRELRNEYNAMAKRTGRPTPRTTPVPYSDEVPPQR